MNIEQEREQYHRWLHSDKQTICEPDENKEILICTLDGYQYFLGPEYDGELDWYAAKHWCESLGEGYELPNRLVMLAICMNEATATLLTEYSYYWTSSEVKDDTYYAWDQYWQSSIPGFQHDTSKSAARRVRAVRRCRIEGEA